jgi:hypothetical protein
MAMYRYQNHPSSRISGSGYLRYTTYGWHAPPVARERERPERYDDVEESNSILSSDRSP